MQKLPMQMKLIIENIHVIVEISLVGVTNSHTIQVIIILNKMTTIPNFFFIINNLLYNLYVYT